MTVKVFIAVTLVVAVTGCARVSESRLNPFNWFGRSSSVETVVVDPGVLPDGRRLVAQVTTLKIEKVPGGAILRATGLPQRQGYFDGELVQVDANPPRAGLITFQFRISSPYETTRVSTVRSREVVVAQFLSDQKLAGIRQIQVTAGGNALIVRR